MIGKEKNRKGKDRKYNYEIKACILSEQINNSFF